MEFITEIEKKKHISTSWELKLKHRKLQWQWFLFLPTKEWYDIHVLNQSY